MRHKRDFKTLERRRLMGTKLLLICDSLGTHWSRLVCRWLEAQQGKMQLEFLPPYVPELNNEGTPPPRLPRSARWATLHAGTEVHAAQTGPSALVLAAG